jgi:hypothetical protein
LLEYKQPHLVLLNRHEPHSAAVMAGQQQHWVLLYQDHLAQLWGRRDIYDREDRAEYFAPDRRRLTAAVPPVLVPWPAAPRQHEDREHDSTTLPVLRTGPETRP